MTTQAYIEDGYTEEGYMKELPHVHQACKFKYRPLLPATVRTTMHKWSEITGEEKTERINNTLVDHLVSWDLTHNKNILPIKAETFMRLRQPFVDRLFNIVTSSDLSDEEIKDKQEKDEADEKN